MQDKMDHIDKELSKILQNFPKSRKLYGWSKNFEKNKFKFQKLKYFYLHLAGVQARRIRSKIFNARTSQQEG